jgi:uncharacterized protein (TIGR02246 family)
VITSSDLAEIHQLYAAYCHFADNGDGDRFSSCFTADARLLTGTGERVGRTSIAEFGVDIPKMLPGIRHLVSNVYVDGDGDEASGSAYVIVMATESGPKMLLTGKYLDKLQHVDGRWLFSERVMTADFTPSAEESRAAGVTVAGPA